MTTEMAFLALVIAIAITLIPWIIGFTWVRSDANHLQQPGIVWALLTIPLSWMAILAYVVVRAIILRNKGVEN